MKRINIILSLFILIAGLYSCEEKVVETGFEDQEEMTIYDYIVENEESYSSFLQIMEAGEINKTLSAYNPYGIGYTLFLPDNEAIDGFIEESDQYSSLNDLLQDKEFSADLARYHVVLMAINANDFPFGALPEPTMSGDFLTVNFVIEEDTSYYKINNQAPVIETNIELSNGFIHIINSVLDPVNFTSYKWLEDHPGFSLFKQAIDATGLKETIDVNFKDETIEATPFTLLVEHDTVFHKRDIHSFEDLAAWISPDNTDYTSISNPLYNFTAYHILEGNRFLDDFTEISTNYTTYSDIPLNIDGVGLDIYVNKGKEIFDTIIDGADTVVIDFVGFNYDASNVLTQSGAMHLVDQVLRQQQPSRATQTFEFWEEPLLNEYREEPGEYLIDDTSSLTYVNWSGADLIFVEEADEDASSAWGGDYLYINGDFSVSYTIPKLVQGKYTAVLGAEALDRNNAVVEVFIDGKNLGGLIDLATGGSTASPFTRIELGVIDFTKYQRHTIEIISLIPGSLYWDYIRFEPF
jgi:uncharacterized surface protein with fasciclin (FAS1) repeats